MTTLRILGANAPQSIGASAPTLAQLHTVIESSVEKLVSGVSFVATAHPNTNADLIRSAENAQKSMAVAEREFSLIDGLNGDLAELYGICSANEGDMRQNTAFAAVMQRIKERLRSEDKVVPLFYKEETLIPKLNWNEKALQLDFSKPKEDILFRISEAVSLLAYAKTRAEASLGRRRIIVAKLRTSRENMNAAAGTSTEAMKSLLECARQARL